MGNLGGSDITGIPYPRTNGSQSLFSTTTDNFTNGVNYARNLDYIAESFRYRAGGLDPFSSITYTYVGKFNGSKTGFILQTQYIETHPNKEMVLERIERKNDLVNVCYVTVPVLNVSEARWEYKLMEGNWNSETDSNITLERDELEIIRFIDSTNPSPDYVDLVILSGVEFFAIGGTRNNQKIDISVFTTNATSSPVSPGDTFLGSQAPSQIGATVSPSGTITNSANTSPKEPEGANNPHVPEVFYLASVWWGFQFTSASPFVTGNFSFSNKYNVGLKLYEDHITGLRGVRKLWCQSGDNLALVAELAIDEAFAVYGSVNDLDGSVDIMLKTGLNSFTPFSGFNSLWNDRNLNTSAARSNNLTAIGNIYGGYRKMQHIKVIGASSNIVNEVDFGRDTNGAQTAPFTAGAIWDVQAFRNDEIIRLDTRIFAGNGVKTTNDFGLSFPEFVDASLVTNNGVGVSQCYRAKSDLYTPPNDYHADRETYLSYTYCYIDFTGLIPDTTMTLFAGSGVNLINTVVSHVVFRPYNKTLIGDYNSNTNTHYFFNPSEFWDITGVETEWAELQGGAIDEWFPLPNWLTARILTSDDESTRTKNVYNFVVPDTFTNPKVINSTEIVLPKIKIPNGLDLFDLEIWGILYKE